MVEPGQQLDVGVPIDGGRREARRDPPGDAALRQQRLPARGRGQRVYHPGDSLTLPPADVDLLLLPVSAPWLKVSECIDFARDVGAPRSLAHPRQDLQRARPRRSSPAPAADARRARPDLRPARAGLRTSKARSGKLRSAGASYPRPRLLRGEEESMIEPHGAPRSTSAPTRRHRASRQLPRMLAPFAIPAYRRMAVALSCGAFAYGVWTVALVWEVIRLGGGPAQLSIVSTAGRVGVLLPGPARRRRGRPDPAEADRDDRRDGRGRQLHGRHGALPGRR